LENQRGINAVFKINTKDGRTEIFDLGDEEKAKKIISLLQDRSYQETITGVSILKSCGGKFKCPQCNKTEFICVHCQRNVSSVVCKRGIQNSLSRPIAARKVVYFISSIIPNFELKNKGGEKITLIADGISTNLIMHENQPASRITVENIGNLRFTPNLD
jgi:hypothetical protein